MGTIQDTARTSLTLSDLEVFYGRSDEGNETRAGEQRFHLRIPKLCIHGGEMVGIAGRSGEGKSTLLHVLALLLRPPKLKAVIYEYKVNGESKQFKYAQPNSSPIAGDLERVRNEAFGFIFQQHFLLPYFSAGENVTLPIMVRPRFNSRAVAQSIRQLLGDFGIDATHENKRPAELSGGQNQRVAVARALLHEPPFLFADEPTANLDKHKRELVLRRLRAAADDGRCVVLVSHELGDLARYCDRLFMVQDNHLRRPFAGDPDSAPDDPPTADPLPPLEKLGGMSQPRTPDDVACITGHMSNLIWPTHVEDVVNKPVSQSQTHSIPTQPTTPLGFRWNALRYARKEVFSRKQALMRILVASLLALAVMAFSYLSNLGQGSVRYLTETTLNKPSEYLNRFIVHRKDPVINRLTSTQIAFLNERIPGLKSPPTLKQSLYQYEVYTQGGIRDRKNYAYSIPDQDDKLAVVPAADRDNAQIGVIYLKGGPFPAGQTDKAGVIISRKFLRETYWRLNDDSTPDDAYPAELEFRLPIGVEGVDEEDLTERFLPGANGRVRIPVVGVFEYPTLVLKNEEDLPQVYFPELFLRRLGTFNSQPLWRWYYPFLTKRIGSDEPLTSPFSILRSVSISFTGGKRTGDWVKAEIDKGNASSLFRDLKRPFGNRLVPTTRGETIILRFDNSREDPLQKLTPAKFETVTWKSMEIEETLDKLCPGCVPKFQYETQPISALFSTATLPPFPAGSEDEVYVEAVVRLTDFRSVIPGRRAVEAEYGEQMVLKPKGGQVVALERFESISGIMKYGHLGLQFTFVVSLMFLIGMTAYMHVSSKTSDIGILRSYGLSPRSIAWVYTLELTMLMVPACILGVCLAIGLAHVSNDWVAETVVLTTSPTDEREADPTSKAVPKPKVFLALQQNLGETLLEACKTVGVVMLVLGVVSGFSVWMIKRQQIVDSLRSGGG